MRPLLLILLLAAPALAADKPIRLPEPPAVPTPMPAPTPPDAVLKLAADQLYVIDSDVPVLVLASPEGVVTVTEESGPVKIRGKFVDGTGRTESRTFKGKSVITVEASHTGRVELLIVPTGAATAKDVLRRTLDVDDGTKPIPPPKPVDPVVPDPPKPVDPPAPIPGDGLRALIVYDTGKVIPAGQVSAINSKKVRDYLDAKTPVVNGAHEYRVWETTEAGANDAKVWQDAAKRAAGKPVPYLIVSNGKTGYEGPVPNSEAEMLALLKKYGD